MEFVHKFEVPLDVEAAWKFANDPAAAVPCMPGAVFEGIGDDGKVRGRIKVKLGAMVSNFAITAKYVELDPVQHTMRLVSEGLEARGGGRTSAEISMKIEPKGEQTSMVTATIQLRMSGKIAQFGKGLLEEVSDRLLAQFLSNVRAKLQTSGARGLSGSETKTVPHQESPLEASAQSLNGTSKNMKNMGTSSSNEDNEPIDLLQIGALAMAKRIAPIVVAFVLGLMIGRFWAVMG